MSDETPTPDATGQAESTELREPVGQPATERTRCRDRVFGLWTLVAVSLAALILGGLGATAVHAVVDDGGHDGRSGHHHELRAPEGGRPPQGGPGPGAPGQVPPATPPTESPTPDGSDDSSGDTSGDAA